MLRISRDNAKHRGPHDGVAGYEMPGVMDAGPFRPGLDGRGFREWRESEEAKAVNFHGP
jgi:hypothetical protein